MVRNAYHGAMDKEARNEALAAYRSKRDFAHTPEPSEAGTSRAGARFVVHEHHASHLHWDLRLEHDGVLVSWAVPKGIPLSPSDKRLAIHVEDHPLSYADFEGEIPPGHYGAGQVRIFDRGTYESERFDAQEVRFAFHGRRLEGRYVLFRTHDTHWILKRRDPPRVMADPLPPAKPMLARLGGLPDDEDAYAFEVKWDGMRALAFVLNGRLRLISRNEHDVTAHYPEIRALGPALSARPAVLDGEIVAQDANGRPSFTRLKHRMGHTAGVRDPLVSAIPVTYMLFDILYLDGRSLLARSYTDRRALLAGLRLEGPAWSTPKAHEGEAAAFLETTRAWGLEGIVAKRLLSPYEPGLRTGAWIKIKNIRRQEFVIGGYRAGAHESLGALLLGYYEPGDPRTLHYAGAVGTGFTRASRAELQALLQARARAHNPFADKTRGAGEVFVAPDLVCEVSYREWPAGHNLRHPAYAGLRTDKAASEVVREDPGERP